MMTPGSSRSHWGHLAEIHQCQEVADCQTHVERHPQPIASNDKLYKELKVLVGCWYLIKQQGLLV